MTLIVSVVMCHTVWSMLLVEHDNSKTYTLSGAGGHPQTAALSPYTTEDQLILMEFYFYPSQTLQVCG